MSDQFASPQIPAMDASPPPEAPRRLMNDRIYREHIDDLPERPITATRKKTQRFHETVSQILVNDSGMVPSAGFRGGFL
jgi:hypothetical protein